MNEFDIYIRRSSNAPFWYVEWDPNQFRKRHPEFAQLSGLQISHSLLDCIRSANQLIRLGKLNPVVAFNNTYSFDVTNDVEVMEALFAHS